MKPQLVLLTYITDCFQWIIGSQYGGSCSCVDKVRQVTLWYITQDTCFKLTRIDNWRPGAYKAHFNLNKIWFNGRGKPQSVSLYHVGVLWFGYSICYLVIVISPPGILLPVLSQTQTLLIFFLILVLQPPTREGPGYATAIMLWNDVILLTKVSCLYHCVRCSMGVTLVSIMRTCKMWTWSD